jgi:hypothetical protein
MNAIVKRRGSNHQRDTEREDEKAHGTILAGNRHSNTDVSDEQPRSDSNDKADLGPHQVAHVLQPTDCHTPEDER